MTSEVGKKRVDDSSPSSSPVKVRKLEHTKDAEPSPIGFFRRYYPFWIDTKGEAEEEEEPVSNDEVNRLVKLLEEDPNKLNEAEQDQLCRYVDVEKITNLAWKWGKERGMEDLRHALATKVKNIPKPDDKERLRICFRMLKHPEKLKESEMRILYTFSCYESALEGVVLLCKVKEGVSRSDIEELFFLSRFLPYKLFAHIFYEKTGIRLFVSDEEGSSDEEPKALREGDKDGVEDCPICGEKNSHLDCLCPYNEDVPLGAKVGPDYHIICKGCGNALVEEACPLCGFMGGRAVLKFCFVCRKFGECNKDDIEHRAYRAREAYVYDDKRENYEYDPTEGGKRSVCSVCYEDDHSAENCWQNG